MGRGVLNAQGCPTLGQCGAGTAGGQQGTNPVPSSLQLPVWAEPNRSQRQSRLRSPGIPEQNAERLALEVNVPHKAWCPEGALVRGRVPDRREEARRRCGRSNSSSSRRAPRVTTFERPFLSRLCGVLGSLDNQSGVGTFPPCPLRDPRDPLPLAPRRSKCTHKS